MLKQEIYKDEKDKSDMILPGDPWGLPDVFFLRGCFLMKEIFILNFNNFEKIKGVRTEWNPISCQPT